MSRRRSRRDFIRLAGGSLGAAALAACAVDHEPVTVQVAEVPPEPTATPARPSLALAPPTPSPTPEPRPIPAAGSVERLLLAGTDWATPAIGHHSGIEGPIVVVLGGVHGNEPGGWTAAEAIAGWGVERGALVTVPRANLLATRGLERTLPDLGDLNRLYPGTTDGEPMAAMALAITELAAEYRADWVIDMHESWGFMREYQTRGTAFIGQTVTSIGSVPGAFELLEDVTADVNAQATEREQLTLRAGWGQRVDPATGLPRVGRSSLSLGAHVPGVTPVLVEMGQERQPLERRAELHRMFVRSLLERTEVIG